MSDHAKYSPSQLKRIIACPGSVKLSEGYTEEESPYAAEGTMLHEIMAATLQKLQKQPSPFLVPVFLEEAINEAPVKLEKEQIRTCEAALDAFLAVFTELKEECDLVKIDIEERVSLEGYHVPDCSGTADVILTCFGRESFRVREIHIIDWKFGQGVYVDVENNPQCQAYLLGACAKWVSSPSAEVLKAHIIQPRLDNYNSHQYTYQELMNWCDTVLKPAIKLAENGTVFFAGEEQCQWCKASGNCKAEYELARDTAIKAFALYTQPDVSDEDKKWILENTAFLTKYVDSVKKEVVARLLMGGEFPGYKLVNGRSSRDWESEETAREWLVSRSEQPGSGFGFEDIFETKLVTPAKAEKLSKGMKKDPEFVALYNTREGAPTLVKAEDKRPEYMAPGATEAFAEFITND
jgi:hypothetical protein